MVRNLVTNLNFLKNIIYFFIDKRPRFTVALIMFAFLCYFYSPILFHPGSYLFGDKGDSIKNYFSYEWHVHNDDSFVNYTGTNYPFGEQHSFTDGNPLLSNLIKVLPFLKGHSIAIFNLSLLFSFIVTAILLFNIFKEFKVANGFSILAAIGITMLCPQTMRLSGHFNLAYSFFIPLIIYLLLLFEIREQKIKYNLLICLVLVLSFFVHPYLGMILASFVFLFHLIKMLLMISSSYFKERWAKTVGSFFLQVIFPVCFYFIYVKITDTHSNRIDHPYGFSYFIARIESVFVSSLPPFRHMLSQIIKIHEQNWEGLAYVGITTLFALLYLPFLLFKKRTRIRSFISENKNAAVFLIMAIASVILLFFSMGYPFKLGGEGILDAIPLIKQFRSPGRFAWVFYFVATIGTTIILTKYFLNGINSYVRNGLIAAMLILFSLEGFPFHKQISTGGFAKNCFDKTELDEEMKQICEVILKLKPQAILPLPFFHIGTDYFSFPGTEKIKTASFITAFNTLSPILGNCTDRTSLDEAKLSIQVIANSLIKRDITDFIKSKDPFCFLYSKETLSEGEQTIFKKGKLLLETENFIVKEVSPTELFSDDIAKIKEYFKLHKGDLQEQNGAYLSKKSFVEFLNFDLLPRHNFKGTVGKGFVLTEIRANTLQMDSVYEVSFWYDLKGGDELAEVLEILEVNTDNIPIAILNAVNCSQMSNVVKDKVLVSADFRIINPANKIKIHFKPNAEYTGDFTLDNLLLRQKNTDVYKMIYSEEKKDSVLMLNNFELR